MMLHCVCILALFSAAPEEWPVLWPTVPPVIESADSLFEELKASNLDKEYAAPIPDSLVVYELSDASGNAVRIILEKPTAEETLTRRSRPAHSWPHMGCLMCLGNHMIVTHGQSTKYLRSITYDQWQILHDNLHNGKNFAGVKGSGEGWIGYEAGGGSYRRGLFGRWRR